MKVTINKETCIGCSACVATCPDNFKMDDENKATAINQEVPEELKECTKNAAESCPVTCIIVEK